MKNIQILVSFLVVFLVAFSCFASPVGGSKKFSVDVQSRDNVTIPIVLAGNQRTTFTIVGDGSTDVDCYLYDENLNLITSDEDSTDVCTLTSDPRWTGSFFLKLENRGSVYNTVKVFAM